MDLKSEEYRNIRIHFAKDNFGVVYAIVRHFDLSPMAIDIMGTKLTGDLVETGSTKEEAFKRMKRMIDDYIAEFGEEREE